MSLTSGGITGFFRNLVKPSQSATDQRNNMDAQGDAASGFADQGQANYDRASYEARRMREALGRRAAGEGLASPEILRQGLQQQYGQQRSMAAGAAPQNAAMAARTAAMNMGRASTAMAGQGAMAELQERQAYEKQLADMIMQGRQQDMQVGLGSRQNAYGAYGGINPEGTTLEKFQPLINAGIGAASVAAGKK
jgi:hypothetical protein